MIYNLNNAVAGYLATPRRRANGPPVAVSRRTAVNVRLKLRYLLARYGDHLIADIGADAIIAWAEHLESNYAEATRAAARSKARAVWRWAVARGWLASAEVMDFLPAWSSRPRRVRVATLDSVRAALSAAARMASGTPRESRDAAIYAVAASGLRNSNVLAIRFSEMVAALAQGGEPVCAHIDGGKRPLELVLDARRAKIVAAWCRARPRVTHDALFVNLDLRPNVARGRYGDPLGENGARQALRHVCRVAGVEPVTFQMLRRTVVTAIARRHGLETAALVAGHTSGTSVTRDFYYDPDRDLARRSAASLWSDSSGRGVPSQTVIVRGDLRA